MGLGITIRWVSYTALSYVEGEPTVSGKWLSFRDFSGSGDRSGLVYVDFDVEGQDTDQTFFLGTVARGTGTQHHVLRVSAICEPPESVGPPERASIAHAGQMPGL